MRRPVFGKLILSIGLAFAGLLPLDSAFADKSLQPENPALEKTPVTAAELDSWVATHVALDNKKLDLIANQLLDAASETSPRKLALSPQLRGALEGYAANRLSPRSVNAQIARFLFVSLLRPAVSEGLSSFHRNILAQEVLQKPSMGLRSAPWPEGYFQFFNKPEQMSNDLFGFARLHLANGVNLGVIPKEFNEKSRLSPHVLKTLKAVSLWQFQTALDLLAKNWPRLYAEVLPVLNNLEFERHGIPMASYAQVVRSVLILGIFDRRSLAPEELSLLTSSFYLQMESFLVQHDLPVIGLKSAPALWQKEFPGRIYPGPSPDELKAMECEAALSRAEPVSEKP